MSPYGLVVHRGHWYLAAHDHLREALRTFRVDRITRAQPPDGPALPAPDGFDPVQHVTTSFAQVPWPWQVDVVLDLPLEEAQRRVPATLAELTRKRGKTRLRMRVSSLDWTASFLAGLGCPFRIERPDELRASVRALGERLASA